MESGWLPSGLGDLARAFESGALSSLPLFKSPKQTIQVSDMGDFKKVSCSTKKALLWHRGPESVCRRVVVERKTDDGRTGGAALLIGR
jgi:hypothetical protein